MRKAQLEPKEPSELRGPMGQLEHKGQPELKGLMELTEPLGVKVRQEFKVQLVHRDQSDNKEQTEILEFKDHPGFKAHLGQSEFKVH